MIEPRPAGAIIKTQHPIFGNGPFSAMFDVSAEGSPVLASTYASYITVQASIREKSA